MAQQIVASPGEPTPFSIDPSDELPVGVQLNWRLRALICTGEWTSGERLPSFRRLAEWAGVNVNTVRAVYEGLEKEGLVVSRQGQGTFVADGVEPSPQLEEIATDALRRAREAGLSPRDLAIVALTCASIPGAAEEDAPAETSVELPGIADLDEAIEVRNELRRQIGRLEAELAAYTRDLPSELPTARRSAEAHIAGVEELEQTRDTMIAKLSEAQKAAELRAKREGEARASRKKIIEGDRSGRALPGAGPLGRAMSSWRAKP
jgi:GntR family transcriptional regulator